MEVVNVTILLLIAIKMFISCKGAKITFASIGVTFVASSL